MPAPDPGGRRRWKLLAAFTAAALLTALSFALLPVRSDLLGLLDTADPAMRLMVEMLARGGDDLVLAAVTAPDDGAAASLADGLVARLSGRPGIAFATDGRAGLDERALDTLFAHRYRLAPTFDPAGFETGALRADFRRLLDALAGPASPLVERWGIPDPTGAFPAVLAAWSGEAGHVGTRHGVWFAPAAAGAPPAALLLVGLTGRSGLDEQAGRAAIATIRAGFAASPPPPGASLALAGPAVLAEAAEASVRHDVRLLSSVSALAIAALLVWRFRSPLVLVAIAIPVMIGLDAAAWITAWRFGRVDAAALGFGSTMLGITVDYPVLLIGHRKTGEAPSGTIARIGTTFAVAVATAAIGLSGMALSPVRAVAELGTFAVVGLLAGALATRFALPPLVVAAGLAPVGAGDERLLLRVEAWRRARPAGIALAALAALVLLVRGLPRIDPDLGRLAPVPAPLLAEDARLRAALGVAEPGEIALVRGRDDDAVLVREEALRPMLDGLARNGAIGGATLASDLLPSVARQRARAAALPDRATLAARVEEARKGMPFRPGAFDPFLADVEAARNAPAVRAADLGAPMLRARLGALLLAEADGAAGIVSFRGVADPRALAGAVTGAGLPFLDLGAATRALARRAVAGARLLVLASAAVAAGALLICLRDPVRTGRIAAAIAASLAVTVAILSLASGRLSLIELVALQFVAGVGLDYALFFSRGPIDAEERARTLRTLATCAAAALIAFGLLAFCRTPLLRELGVTVSLGVASAMLFAFLLARPTRTLGP